MTVGALTQSRLADRLGVTFAALNRWLGGHAVPQPRRMAAIEALYREVVGYPFTAEEDVARVVHQARTLRKKDLWGTIARRSSLRDELLLEHTCNGPAE